MRDLAAGLHAQGVRRDGRVALLLPNGAGFVIAYFASVALGAAVVPLNDGYQETELLRFLRDCRVSCVVTTAEREARCRTLLAAPELSCALLVVDETGADVRRPPTSRPSLDGAARA